MLIQDFVQVDRPFAAVCSLVRSDLHGTLDRHAAAAFRDGEEMSASLMPPPGLESSAGSRVAVDVGEPYERVDGLVIPIQWWVKGSTGLFARLEGDLQFAPIGADSAQITLAGRYDRPARDGGRRLDRMLLHRVAELSVRSFLNRLATALLTSIAPGRAAQNNATEVIQ